MSAVAFSDTLELERVFNAPIEKVFEAWISADVLAQWFGPEGFEVIEAKIDCRPQGEYSITIQSPDNMLIKHFGEYIEVDKPNKLIFTWVLENQACRGSSEHTATTLVELNFIEQQQQTLILLKHEKLPDQTALDGHRFGWQSSFNSLQNLLKQ